MKEDVKAFIYYWPLFAIFYTLFKMRNELHDFFPTEI